MAGYYTLKRSGAAFAFCLKARNHEPILTSELHGTMQGAEGGIASVKVNSAIEARYFRRISTSSQPYFVLTAANGEVIGRSEMYSSTAAMEGGINLVKMYGPSAPIQDKTWQDGPADPGADASAARQIAPRSTVGRWR